MEEETRWNSTYRTVAAALATLTTDLSPWTATEYEATVQCVRILSPFQPQLSVRLQNNSTDLYAQTYTSNLMTKQLGLNLSRILTVLFSGIDLWKLLDKDDRNPRSHCSCHCGGAVISVAPPLERSQDALDY